MRIAGASLSDALDTAVCLMAPPCAELKRSWYYVEQQMVPHRRTKVYICAISALQFTQTGIYDHELLLYRQF
jgi:hypothetical protein